MASAKSKVLSFISKPGTSKWNANTLHAPKTDGRKVTGESTALGMDERSSKANLFSLPTELHAQILVTLSFGDLCSFRLVCRDAWQLISAGDIVRQWIDSHTDWYLLKLYPPPKSSSFRYAIEQRRRYAAADDMSTLLAEYIERQILRYTLRRLDVFPHQTRTDLFEGVRAKLKYAMIPLLLTVQHYLEHCAESMLHLFSQHDQTLSEDYLARERKLFASYDPQRLLQAHKFWLFLTWLNNQLLSRPSYVGSVERTMRGWFADPLSPHEFRLFMVFGNLRMMGSLVRLGSYKARRRTCESWIHQLDPEKSVEWRQHWEDILPRLGEHPTPQQTKVLQLRMAAGEIWVNSARAALMGQGLIEQSSDKAIGTPWQTMDFLCEIAGYDVLHTPPSMIDEHPNEHQDYALE